MNTAVCNSFGCVWDAKMFTFANVLFSSSAITVHVCIIALQPWWHHIHIFFFLFILNDLVDIINTTKNIQWSKVASDIQVLMNNTVVRTGAFVSENVWGSDFFQASLISFIFLVAYWSIIYLDSSQPGVIPPSPLALITRQK